MVQDLGRWSEIGITLNDCFEIGNSHVWTDVDGKKILAGDDTLRCCYRNGDMPESIISMRFEKWYTTYILLLFISDTLDYCSSTRPGRYEGFGSQIAHPSRKV